MIQYSEGNIHMSPDDFQATDSGITYGIKFRMINAASAMFAMILERIDGDWTVVKTIDFNVNSGIANAGGPAAYAENVIRPAVKTWLAARKLQAPTPAHEVAALVGKWLAL